MKFLEALKKVRGKKMCIFRKKRPGVSYHVAKAGRLWAKAKIVGWKQLYLDLKDIEAEDWLIRKEGGRE